MYTETQQLIQTQTICYCLMKASTVNKSLYVPSSGVEWSLLPNYFGSLCQFLVE